MTEKTIDRNEILLTGDTTESFYDEFETVLEVKRVWDWPGGCFIEMGKQGSLGEVSFFLTKDGAERLAQAVLALSGARKVV